MSSAPQLLVPNHSKLRTLKLPYVDEDSNCHGCAIVVVDEDDDDGFDEEDADVDPCLVALCRIKRAEREDSIGNVR